MYNVVIADDEPIIISGLKKMIPWDSLQLKLAGCAKDGIQAWELIREMDCHIIITDVSMPGLDGIGLLKRISEEKPSVKVIFVSAYQEFFYVKEALRYGAVEYLVKPVEKENLVRCLQRCLFDIRQNESTGFIQNQKSEMELLFQQMEEAGGFANYGFLYQKFSELGYDCHGKHFLGVCFQIQKKGAPCDSKAESQRMELLQFAVFGRLQSWYENKKQGFLVKWGAGYCVLVLILDKSSYHMKNIQAVYIDEIASQIEQEYRISLVIGIGAIYEGMNNLQQCYKTAVFCGELYFFIPKHRIIYEQIHQFYTFSFGDFDQKCEQIKGYINARDDSALNSIAECLEIIYHLHFGNKSAAVNRSVILADMIYNSLVLYNAVDENARAEQEEFLEQMRGQCTFEDLKNVFMDYYRRISEDFFADYTSRNFDKMLELKHYIDRNYSKNITLDELASRAFMNPNYLSRSFKRAMGINLKAYLTDVRMKNAVNLLLTTNMLTYEIAEKVGYQNVRQFSDKFRDYYDMSPKEYRQLRQKEKGEIRHEE